MASALKLKNDINKLKAALKSKATPKSFIPKLKSQLEKAEADYESVKAGKKSAPKASKQVKSTMDKLKQIIKKKKYGAYRAQGVDLKKDADRPALPTGKRISKNGNTYYEYRANRIDVKQPPKRYPKLEDGGEIKDQYENMSPKQVWEKWNSNQREHFVSDHYEEWNGSWSEDKKSLPKLSFEKVIKKVPNFESALIRHIDMGQYASGGYMAKGGEIYKIQQKFKYDLQPKWEDEKFQTGGHYYLSFKEAQDVKKKLQGLSSSMEYKVVKVEEKMAGGGEVSKEDFLSKSIVYDNGGASLDRYTVYTPDGSVYGMSETGGGFNQYLGEADEIPQGKHLGKKLKAVPKEIESAVLNRMEFAKGGYMADGGTIDNSGMTPADLQKKIWNLTARIAKLGDIESRAASDEINMLMKQRKKLQSMALSLGDMTMAQGGELHRNQEDKFKYGGYMAEGGVIELKSVGTYFRPSDLATSTDGTFSEDDMFYLSDIDNYEWWHGLSKEDRAKIEEHFDVDKHLINKFDTKDLDTYDKEAKEMKGGGYMAKGGALEHGLKKGDHIMVIRGNMLGIKNEITGDVVTLNIETGERKETKE